MNRTFYGLLIIASLFSSELISKELTNEIVTISKPDESEVIKKDKIGFFSITGEKENIDNPWTIICP